MKRTIAKLFVAAVAGLGVFSVPSTATAADRFYVGVGVSNHDHREAERRWVPPVYEERCTQVWVEPVYRTEYRTHWVKPEYRTVCERVWVEPVYEWREVVSYERGRRCVHRQRVCVRPGGWQNVERQVMVTPGHEKNEACQVLVVPGHFETRKERVCVREGYWQTAEYRHRDNRDNRERVSFDFNIGGIFR